METDRTSKGENISEEGTEDTGKIKEGTGEEIRGVEYTKEQINEALAAGSREAGYRIVPSRDLSGHGTEVLGIARRFEKIGYRIYATRGTAKVLQEAGVNAIRTNKIEQESPNLLDLILGHKIDLVIDTPSQGVEHSRDGFLIRRTAIETGVNVLTAMDTARALVTSLENTDIKKLTLIDIATVKNI